MTTPRNPKPDPWSRRINIGLRERFAAYGQTGRILNPRASLLFWLLVAISPFIVLWLAVLFWGETPAHRAMSDGRWSAPEAVFAIAVSFILQAALSILFLASTFLRRSAVIEIDEQGLHHSVGRKQRLYPWPELLGVNVGHRAILFRYPGRILVVPRRAIGSGIEVSDLLANVDRFRNEGRPTMARPRAVAAKP